MEGTHSKAGKVLLGPSRQPGTCTPLVLMIQHECLLITLGASRPASLTRITHFEVLTTSLCSLTASSKEAIMA